MQRIQPKTIQPIMVTAAVAPTCCELANRGVATLNQEITPIPMPVYFWLNCLNFKLAELSLAEFSVRLKTQYFTTDNDFNCSVIRIRLIFEFRNESTRLGLGHRIGKAHSIKVISFLRM